MSKRSNRKTRHLQAVPDAPFPERDKAELVSAVPQAMAHMMDAVTTQPQRRYIPIAQLPKGVRVRTPTRVLIRGACGGELERVCLGVADGWAAICTEENFTHAMEIGEPPYYLPFPLQDILGVDRDYAAAFKVGTGAIQTEEAPTQ